jgi:hypothetical protein
MSRESRESAAVRRKAKPPSQTPRLREISVISVLPSADMCREKRPSTAGGLQLSGVLRFALRAGGGFGIIPIVTRMLQETKRWKWEEKQLG